MTETIPTYYEKEALKAKRALRCWLQGYQIGHSARATCGGSGPRHALTAAEIAESTGDVGIDHLVEAHDGDGLADYIEGYKAGWRDAGRR